MRILISGLLASLVLAGGSADVQAQCHTKACHKRVAKKHKRKVVRPHKSWLRRLRACESGGRYWLSTGNGFYGAYQFDLRTWRSVGGRGFPNGASHLEQDYRAVKLYHRRGTAPWPVCG